MAPITNARQIFNEIPADYPIPGRTVVYDASQTIDLENVPLRGGILLKTLVLSIDPYLRGRMRDSAIKSYTPAFQLGQPLENYGLGVVVRSENPTFNAGDHIYGIFPFEEYSVHTQVDDFSKIENKYNLPWSVFVGAAGMPGQTAYCAWKEYAQAKKVNNSGGSFVLAAYRDLKGDVAFISTGAGAVGSLVIQLAKRDGLKVIASAGSDEKVAFMKELGADVAFNYKTTKTSEVLKKEGPIDVYWDNVGGETLEAALQPITHECGMISAYNTKPYPVMNLSHIVTKKLKLYGFIVRFLLPSYKDAFYAEIPALIASGELKIKEDLAKGLESVGDAILAVQKGTNTGKSVIVVAE